MARRKYGLTEAKIARFYREGRGQGTGKDYKPFFTVADVPSHGRVHRVFCPLTLRTHHLLSDNEYYFFFTQWWKGNVIDIREQYPLDRRETLEIAACCGVEHPVDRHSGALWVMTTDQLVTVQTVNGVQDVAYAVKEVEALNDKRTIQKLEIERRYWERREIPWKIVTSLVKNTYTKNLEWILHRDGPRVDCKILSNVDIEIVKEMLAEQMRMNPKMTMHLLCRTVDHILGLKRAVTLGVLRMLLGAKVIHVDLNLASLPDLPAESFFFGREDCKNGNN